MKNNNNQINGRSTYLDQKPQPSPKFCALTSESVAESEAASAGLSAVPMTVLYRSLSILPEKICVVIPKYTGLSLAMVS